MYRVSLALATALLSQLAWANNDNDNDNDNHGPHPVRTYKHVALFSVDGLHSSDLPKWVALNPKSTIASLLETGYWYQGALTAAPSDSFPGTVNLVAGATPATSGIWYDDAYGN
jgi:predicted AlkP superfamily pyrophosphatase or phosphodiesterase